ncbi:MAG TPA: hypothetical protein VEA69_17725 [Tepidisphaeraceae bacterium]|nr:hypothetical protein [Tepidisphaeraceae bacterium]
MFVRSERLTDDGRGALHQTAEQTAQWCRGCGRPVADVGELRGTCDWCGTGGCCVHCLARCEVCSRLLCGRCRCGFVGPPALTVCWNCQARLAHRQVLQDQQAAFENELARHRLFNQDQALRLNFERTHLSAELQAARLGLDKVWWPVWVLKVAGRGVMKVVRYAWRAVRRRASR